MLWAVVLALLVCACLGDGSLSWDEYAELIESPPQFRLADRKTFGALTSCSSPTVFDPALNVSWVFDTIALNSFVGKGAAFMLRSVGLNEATIRGLAAANNTCLIVFEAPTQVVPSTWEGLASVVRLFSATAADRVLSMVDLLRALSFEAIMGAHAITDSNYREPVLDAEALSWTLAKFESASSFDVFAVRSFLYNVLNANNLFLGNGLSYSSNYGESQNPEYVTSRLVKADLPKWKQIKVFF